MLTRQSFRFPTITIVLLGLALTLASCGDDEQSPTTPVPPQPPPAGWYKQDALTVSALLSVRFVTANKGVIVGAVGTMRRTGDGGRTWFAPSGGTSDRLTSVADIKASLGRK